jgi:hypothetical protein
MIKRIITARPAISLTTALVGLICIFFIAVKENQIKTESTNALHFQEKSRAAALKTLLPPNEYTPKQMLALQYLGVELEGAFLPDQEVYLANRSAANNSKPNSKKASGFHLLAPFLLTSGQVVWVNRGWIARDPANRRNIPVVTRLRGPQTITGYVTLNNTSIFELGAPISHRVNGSVIASNFQIPHAEKDFANRDVYPFLITQTGTEADQLIRPPAGYRQEVNYSFELRTWWFILLFTVGFWFVSGVIFIRRQSKLYPSLD